MRSGGRRMRGVGAGRWSAIRNRREAVEVARESFRFIFVRFRVAGSVTCHSCGWDRVLPLLLRITNFCENYFIVSSIKPFRVV